MKKQFVLLAVLAIFIATMTQFCAGRRYETPAFYEKAEHHRVIAVLPYEMIFTGKKPKKLSVHDVREIEEAESLAFQESLYHLLMRQSSKRRRPVRIEVQDVVKTNKILGKNKIDLRDSWHIESEELARLLKVDAVVRTKVMKRRYMSGLTSFGVELGSAILSEVLTDSPLAIFVSLPTNSIKAECFLLNGSDGAVLWGIDLVDHTDWRLKANDIIDNINRYFARKFPYR